MPVVIHTREAFEDTLAVLAESGFDARRTVFHSFTGGPADVRRLLDLGAWISYSGIATFKRTGDIRAGAALVPPERILVETDAPFLAPEPVRNMKVNEPANVAHVAACLAAARGEPAEAFAGQTAANAERFFALDAAAAGA
jgi:TatD DNase family protein